MNYNYANPIINKVLYIDLFKSLIMNKELIVSAILSAIHLISNELESIEDDGLRNEFELTLAELELALKELTKE